MAKQPPPLDDALRAKFAAARAAESQADSDEPRARDAWYDANAGLVKVALTSGAHFAFPPTMFPELAGRTASELIRLELSPSGDALLWDEIDVHIATAGVLVAMLGPAMFRVFASVGGRATSERKAAAARANGARGGRPRKQSEPVQFRPDASFGVMKVAEVRQERPASPPPYPDSDPQ